MQKINSTLFISLLFGSVFAAHADHDRVQIRTIDVPPYGVTKQGEPTGIYYDLANLVVENAGYSTNNIIAPYGRIIKALKFGDADITIMFRYPELDKYVEYIAPLSSKKLVVLGLEGNKFENIKQLSGKNLLYLRGATFNKLIDNDETITKHFFSNYIIGLKILTAGRADAIIGSLQTIQRSAKELERMGHPAIHFSEPLILGEKTPWIQMSKKAKPYLDIKRLKDSFSQLEELDTYNNLKIKYNIH